MPGCRQALLLLELPILGLAAHWLNHNRENKVGRQSRAGRDCWSAGQPTALELIQHGTDINK